MNHKKVVAILKIIQYSDRNDFEYICNKLKISLEDCRYYWEYIKTKQLCEYLGTGKYKLTFTGIDYLDSHSLKNKAKNYASVIIASTISGVIVAILSKINF